MIYIASDHGGFNFKKLIYDYLMEKNIPVTDLGPYEIDPNDDYPDYVSKLTSKVLENSENKGILICRNGVGVCMAANRYNGIRCTLSWNPDHTRSTRVDDNSNVLALPGDYISNEEALACVRMWLETPFSNQDRHVRRLEKVDNLNSK